MSDGRRKISEMTYCLLYANPAAARSIGSMSDFAENGLVRKARHPDCIAAIRIPSLSLAVI
jgi:hypothetical protein